MPKKKTNKVDQVSAFRVDADLMAAMEADRLASFEDTIPDIVRIRLAEFYAMGAPDPVERSPIAVARDRKAEIENELLELKLATERGQVIPVALVKERIQKRFAVLRARLNTIPDAVIGVTPDQRADLLKVVEDCMTDLSGGDPEGLWDDMD